MFRSVIHKINHIKQSSILFHVQFSSMVGLLIALSCFLLVILSISNNIFFLSCSNSPYTRKRLDPACLNFLLFFQSKCKTSLPEELSFCGIKGVQGGESVGFELSSSFLFLCMSVQVVVSRNGFLWPDVVV